VRAESSEFDEKHTKQSTSFLHYRFVRDTVLCILRMQGSRRQRSTVSVRGTTLQCAAASSSAEGCKQARARRRRCSGGARRA